MTKFIILDGLDNTGKTFFAKTFIELLQEKGHTTAHEHFPSFAICESRIFKELLLPENKKNHELKKEFIMKVLEEEKLFLKKAIQLNSDVVVIDRFLISSLVYQGESVEGDWKIDMWILNRYVDMFQELGLEPKDFFHFLFVHKILDDHTETNETKKKFDRMNDELKLKFDRILYNVFTEGLMSDHYMNTTNMFLMDEKVFLNRSVALNQKELNTLNAGRLEMVYDIAEIGEVDLDV